MSSLVDKAGDVVSSKTPHVLGALRRIRFLLVGIPLLSVIGGIAVQAVMPERGIVSATFKVGSIATPGSPANTVPLASNTQMKARLRTTSIELRDKYPGALLLKTSIDNDVVTVTATALGIEDSKEFLHEVMDREISFHNDRLQKLRVVQKERRDLLEAQLRELEKRVAAFTEMQKKVPGENEVTGFALQKARSEATDRISKIKLKLNSMKLVGASDLFVDSSAIIQPPLLIARSQWYRPVLFGLIGLGVGLLLTVVLAGGAVIRALTRKSASAKNTR